MPDTGFSLKVYRSLLRLYPARFRENYAAPMEREFRDELAEANGSRGLAALWLRLLADFLVSLPLQRAREASQDVRHTARLWAARPWHTAFAVLALAIGIGATTGVFSVVNALLLRSLPFREPERLALLRDFLPPHDSAAAFHNWPRQSSCFADAALVEEFDANLGGAGGVQRAHIAVTSANFFSTLGTEPVVGRGFAPGEDTAGRDAVTVIGYGLWQQLFAGVPQAVGSTIRVDGKPLTVIGVAPPGFDFPGHSVLWQPAAYAPGNNGWATIARLKHGIPWLQARAAFDAEADRLAPAWRRSDPRAPRPAMLRLQDGLAGPAKNASLLFLAAVVLVLLIACTNVAHLLLARAADRTVEWSIRSALGAGRARLAQQLLTECLLLSLAAAVAGVLLAWWTVSLAAKVQPAPLGLQSYSLLDGRILAFTILVAIVSGLLFGVFPAVYVGRIHTFGSRSGGRTRGSRLVRELLAGAQVTLTMILLAASVSVGRAFLHLMQMDRGYSVQGIVTVNVSLEGTTHQQNGRLAYFMEALGRIRRLPGVRAAGATEFLPLYATGFIGGPFGLDGRPARRNSMIVPVLPGYFETMRGRIRYGREFTGGEVRSGARVAVVNERFAAEFGTPEEAVGRRLTAGRQPPYRIIGVVAAMDYATDPGVANEAQVFLPSSAPGGFFSTFVARVDGPAANYLASVRDAVRSVDAQVPVFGVKTMEQRLEEITARPKFYRTAVWSFAGFGLLLALIGIYGIVSYTVAERTQEMGVRLALGSTSAQLRGMLLRQELLIVAAGALPGIAAAQFTGRLLESLVDGARSIDPATSAGLVLLVALVASTSIWTATRRIARLDIAATLVQGPCSA